MRTDGLIFADDEMMVNIEKDDAHRQVANMATLPGIVGPAMAMPDIHYGFGFPIGGVAAFDINDGIISPGGIGYDINCGVRLLKTGLSIADLDKRDISRLCDKFYRNVPSGVGSSGRIKISKLEIKKVLETGAGWAVQNGYGNNNDLNLTEENGCMNGADAGCVSDRALERGRNQLGTLGAGNHFLEIQEVVEIYDDAAANNFGLYKGQIVIMIHTGSRGLGHQICDDYIKKMTTATQKYSIKLTDKQLACAPFASSEGQEYFTAMQCGANYAWTNRQCIMHAVIKSVRDVCGESIEINMLYDVCHNIGKLEEHNGKKLIVHRKGATRSFGPASMEITKKYRDIGQPVLVPGTMGTSSYVMKGTQTALKESFGSTCHGAGRVWSRTKAKKMAKGADIKEKLKRNGITVLAKNYKTIAEEAPQAYKDISQVVSVCHNAGLAEKVAKLIPLGVVKG